MCSLLLGFLIAGTGRSFLDDRVILAEDCLFLQVILPEIRTVSFTQNFRCSCTRNEFKTVAIPKMFTYLTEHPDFPGHCGRGKRTNLGQSIKNSKTNFIVTKFFTLIKVLYILGFFIFQGLIHEIKNTNMFYLFHGLT